MTTPTKIEAYLPAEAVAVRPDLLPGVHIDAMTATINHVQGAITTVEVLLGEACEDRPADHVLSAMLAGVDTTGRADRALQSRSRDKRAEGRGG
jgi:hypothetical protein